MIDGTPAYELLLRLADHMGVTYAQMVTQLDKMIDPVLTNEEKSMAVNGHRVHAIQNYYGRVGCTLEQATKIVDNFLKWPLEMQIRGLSSDSDVPAHQVAIVLQIYDSGNALAAYNTYAKITNKSLQQAKVEVIKFVEDRRKLENDQLLGKYPLIESEKNDALNHNKIRAIKSFRNRTGLGLRECKTVVDAFLGQ